VEKITFIQTKMNADNKKRTDRCLLAFFLKGVLILDSILEQACDTSFNNSNT